MNECTICFQEYGDGCLPATLPCGHVNCFDCLTLLASNNHNGVCSCCRQPYSDVNITKLFLTFPVPAPPAVERAEEIEESPQQADPPPLTTDQEAEASELSARMSAIGVDTNVEELGHVLSDVKLWAGGVAAISDMETQIAMTRLLLSVDILRQKTEKSVLSAAGVRKTEDALAASRRAEASLRDKLNRENVQTTRLRRAAVEQLTHLHKWKDVATKSKARIDELEDIEMEHLSNISSLTKQTKDQALEIASLSERIEAIEKSAIELDHRTRSMYADKKRYDKRVANLEKELDAQQQINIGLRRDLRREEARNEEYKEHAEVEVVRLVKKLRDTEAAHSDCQRELSRATAAIEENARQILRLKQDREHWREEYFKLKENGPSLVLSSGVPGADARNNSATSSQINRELSPSGTSSAPESPEPQMCQPNLIDLSDEPDASPPGLSRAGPSQSQQNTSRTHAIKPLARPFVRLPKRTRVEDELNSSSRSSFPPRKRHAGAHPGNIAPGFEARRKASGESRGLGPLHELLASAADDDG